MSTLSPPGTKPLFHSSCVPSNGTRSWSGHGSSSVGSPPAATRHGWPGPWFTGAAGSSGSMNGKVANTSSTSGGGGSSLLRSYPDDSRTPIALSTSPPTAAVCGSPVSANSNETVSPGWAWNAFGKNARKNVPPSSGRPSTPIVSVWASVSPPSASSVTSGPAVVSVVSAPSSSSPQAVAKIASAANNTTNARALIPSLPHYAAPPRPGPAET